MPLYWNRQCGIGGPGSVRVVEAGEKEAPSRVPGVGGPGRVGLQENPRGVGPGRGPGEARTLRLGWVTYVCVGG